MKGFYAALDVSDANTSICVIDAKGKLVFETSAATTPLAIARELKPYAKVLEKVGHEAGSRSSWLHKELTKRRLPMVCLDPRVMSGAIRAQRNKTDRNDARAMAQVLRTGWYGASYVKSDEALRVRLLLTLRLILRRKAGALEIALGHAVKAFGAKCVRDRDGPVKVIYATKRPDPDIARLAQAMSRASTALRAEVAALDRVIAKMVKADRDCQRFMTMPGVGPLTAISFKAAIDDPHRFRSSRAVGANFGLTPRRRQSGQSDYSGRISKIGESPMRSLLYEAAFALIANSKSKCRLRLWAVGLRKKRGLKFACIACARKMAVILHRMWITERDFDQSAPA